MTEPTEPSTTEAQTKPMERAIDEQATRKLKAQRESLQSVWRGLGMMGLVGWSVVVPTLIGAAFGLWLDEHFPRDLSWTLALLVAGLFIGCLNAWHWVAKEDRAMHERQENDDE